MRRFYIWLWLLLLVCGSCTKEKQELSVLHLNIWMEGTVVKNGFEAVADEVARIDPYSLKSLAISSTLLRSTPRW